MSTTTTNFGWTVPSDTDLVKDGAAAIRTALGGVDTSFVDLKGGTTGQLLSKASGSDLDYTWVDPSTGDITGVTAGTGISGGGTSGTVTVTNSMATAIDAKGDLIVGTAADTFSRLAVGTNGYVLTADSAEATGIKWASASGSSGPTFSAYKSGGTQSYSTSTWTKVTFETESWDSAGNFASSRFTPTTAGYYQLNVMISASFGTRCAIYKNGASISRGFGVGSIEQIGLSKIVSANGSTDYFEIYVWDDSSPEVYQGEAFTWFDGVWIRGL